MTGVRDDVFEFLSKNDIEFVASDANMFMMNAKRPGKMFGTAMAKEKVYVGRVWPIWPTWVRSLGRHKGRDGQVQTGLLEMLRDLALT